jgi:serine/threonine-protein kinase RsbW
MSQLSARGVCPHQWEEHGSGESWRQRSLHTAKEMDEVIQEVLCSLEEAGFSVKETFAVRLAVEEAIANAIKHGHQGDPTKEVRVRYHATPTCVLVEVHDEGPGFRPDEVPDPLAPENLESDHGRGLLLMRTYMSWVGYNDKGTCVTMCKKKQ